MVDVSCVQFGSLLPAGMGSILAIGKSTDSRPACATSRPQIGKFSSNGNFVSIGQICPKFSICIKNNRISFHSKVRTHTNHCGDANIVWTSHMRVSHIDYASMILRYFLMLRAPLLKKFLSVLIFSALDL